MKKLSILFVAALALLTSCEPPKQSAAPTDTSNTVVETILARRSIRAYKPEQLSAATLDTLIKCAINAPSARNEQPWEVRFVQNAELIAQIEAGNDAYVKAQDPTKSAGHAFYGAPTIAVVAYHKDNNFGQLDCGWLGQNILISAESMGLGTCVVGGIRGYFASEGAKEVLTKLNFSADYEVLYVIAIGYKNQSPEAKPRNASKVTVIE